MKSFHFRLASAAKAATHGLRFCFIAFVRTSPAAIMVHWPESVTVASSPSGVTTGYLDVYITATGQSIGEPLGSFDAGLEFSDNTANGKLSFQNALQSGQSIHPGHTPLISASSPTTNSSGQEAFFFNSVPGANSSVPIFNNAGLATIPFTIQPGVSGTFAINIDSNPARTNFSDGNGNDLTGAMYNDTVTFGSATITINSVPEPSSFALAGIGLAVGGWWLRRRHRASSSPERKTECPAVA